MVLVFITSKAKTRSDLIMLGKRLGEICKEPHLLLADRTADPKNEWNVYNVKDLSYADFIKKLKEDGIIEQDI